MKRISRKQAIQQGLHVYFTGKPCIHGHVFFRAVTDRKCKGCSDVISTAKIAKQERSERPSLGTNYQWRIDTPVSDMSESIATAELLEAEELPTLEDIYQNWVQTEGVWR